MNDERPGGLLGAMAGAVVTQAATWRVPSTAPLTASQRSYEACGFRAAYPKLELELARG